MPPQKIEFITKFSVGDNVVWFFQKKKEWGTVKGIRVTYELPWLGTHGRSITYIIHPSGLLTWVTKQESELRLKTYLDK